MNQQKKRNKQKGRRKKKLKSRCYQKKIAIQAKVVIEAVPIRRMKTKITKRRMIQNNRKTIKIANKNKKRERRTPAKSEELHMKKTQ